MVGNRRGRVGREHFYRSLAHLTTVQPVAHFGCVNRILEIDEGIAEKLTRPMVSRQVNCFDRAALGKEFSEIVCARFRGQITGIESHSRKMLQNMSPVNASCGQVQR